MKSTRKAKPKKTPKHKTRAAKRTITRVARTKTPVKPTATNPYTSPDFKICEEIEVGDIGGFGIASEERMEQETRCNQRATQFCKSCQRNLCNTHYELLHRDHDNPVGHDLGTSTVTL